MGIRVTVVAALAAGLLAVGASSAVRGSAVPLQLVFDGIHVTATIPSPSGLMHQGTFTSNEPFCPGGTAVDVLFSGEGGQRKFTCSTGGDFVAQISSFPAEHGGSGSWAIISGTGPLANIRGHGTFASVHRDDSRDPQAYRSTWSGVMAVDATPPAISLSGASLKKLGRPAGSYTLRVTLSIADESDPVSYGLTVADARRPDAALATKNGIGPSGSTTLVVRVRPAKTAKKLIVRVRATDAVDNDASRSLGVPIKHR